MSEIIINKYSENGICYPKISLNIRTIPCAITGVVLDQYYVGESVIYDQVVITDKHVWISWLSTSGRRVYMAIKDQITGERWGDCNDVPSTSTGSETIVNEYSESGICYPRMTLNIRDLPCATTGTILDQYYVGESVIYDYVVITDRYVWISWTSAGSGRRVYMAVKDKKTGERFGICADIPGSSGISGGGSGIGMPGVKKVFIDAGHGGSDPGASGNGLKEKDIVLNISQKLASLFNARGIQVSHSRYSDTSVGLSERAEMANRWGADLFISIHANALDGSGSAYGTECYTHPNSTTENKRISTDISFSISNKLGTYNRGHKEADFAVLRLTNMPAVLIETAFIDNAGDAEKLKNRQNDFADAIAREILNYLNINSTKNNELEQINNNGFAKEFGVEFSDTEEEILILQSGPLKISLEATSNNTFGDSPIVVNIENGELVGGTLKTDFIDFGLKLADKFEISLEKLLLELGSKSISVSTSKTSNTTTISFIYTDELNDTSSIKQILKIEFDENKAQQTAEEIKAALEPVLEFTVKVAKAVLVVASVILCILLAVEIFVAGGVSALITYFTSLFLTLK